MKSLQLAGKELSKSLGQVIEVKPHNEEWHFKIFGIDSEIIRYFLLILSNPIIWWIGAIISLLFDSSIAIDPWNQFNPSRLAPTCPHKLWMLQISLFSTAWLTTVFTLFEIKCDHLFSFFGLNTDKNNPIIYPLKNCLLYITAGVSYLLAAVFGSMVLTALVISFVSFAIPYIIIGFADAYNFVIDNFKMIILCLAFVSLTICIYWQSRKG